MLECQADIITNNKSNKDLPHLINNNKSKRQLWHSICKLI
ncbi:MAG: hypothetical protein KIC78_12095 [Prevotella sp.]|nr:hypothetical protein [Prevotella sp.]